MAKVNPTPSFPPELDALFALAIREQKAGRPTEAAAAYQKILAIRPDITEVHNNLANVLASQGKFDEAAAHFQQALALKPDYANAHNNLGNVLRSQHKLDEAAAHYAQALTLKPDYADAQYNLGNTLKQQGKLDEAVACFQQLLALRPGFAQAHNSLGDAFKQLGKIDQARLHLERALALRPDYAEAQCNLGDVLRSQGKLDEAAARYELALALKPNYLQALINLGDLLTQQGRFERARARFEQLLALRPNYAEAHYNLGYVLLSQGKLDEAAAHYEHALALRPDFVEAHNNLGNVLERQGKFDQARARFEQLLALQPDCAEAYNNLGAIFWRQDKLDQAAARYEQALTLRPDYTQAHHNLGNVRLTQRRLDEAAAHYQQALALTPDYAEAQMGLATCYLLQGDYERGWPAYEARLRIPGFVPQPNLPRWAGEPWAGRTLLLLAEQGLGDTVQFVRYARPLKERGARVVLAAQAPLGRLLESHPDLDELFILGSAEELPRCDFYLPLLGAPGACGTDASTIPCKIPYLTADPGLTDLWGRELAGFDGFKIAIAWQGSRVYRTDRWRSIPLAHFAPLASLPGVRLVSLQKGFGSEQVATVDFPVLDLSSRLDESAGPFMDTAAVIRGVDLVVTADTVIAHLAGALGVPVWIAPPFSPDWRWLLERDDSPWYPTMRLFRQTAFGEWSNVFERIAEAVEAYRAEKTASDIRLA